ncbi:MAG TPA: peptide-methionine (S)-S-oxide reductase MsrA [Candidatus Limnocylindrales bacterium]|nr:peptide-methionine (S)-S-oxide reductase MsrA [Candidatus Limnocylindrales bacterium]
MKKYIIFLIAAVIVYLGFNVFFKHTPVQKSDSIAAEKTIERRPRREADKVAIFAGGCFWSLESYFEKIPKGIVDVRSGFTGGRTENVTYENYVAGGHREAVEVVYDPTIITYGELAEYYFRHIDPTDPGGSFFDRGEGYTSAVYYENEDEKRIANDVSDAITKAKIFEKPIVTEIIPASDFWPAEEEHQDYAYKNPERYAPYRIGSGRDAFLSKT